MKELRNNFIKRRENFCVVVVIYLINHPFNSVIQGLRRSYTIALVPLLAMLS